MLLIVCLLVCVSFYAACSPLVRAGCRPTGSFGLQVAVDGDFFAHDEEKDQTIEGPHEYCFLYQNVVMDAGCFANTGSWELNAGLMRSSGPRVV